MTRVRRVARELLRLTPAPGSGSPAWRASLTVLVVLGGLLAAGRLDLAAYASFGAFASVYGGRDARTGRWRDQLVAAGLLNTAVLAGTVVAASTHRAWLAVPGAGLWAFSASLLSDRYAWRPAGPLFLVFAFATCAAIPTRSGDILDALSACAAATALAVVLGVCEERVVGRAGPASSPPRAVRWGHGIAAGLSVVTAGGTATGLGLDHPYWAMVAAAVPFAADTASAQVVRGLHRVIGTLAGLVVAAAVLGPDLPATLIVVLVAVLQALTELTVGRNYGLALFFITPLSLLVVQLGHSQNDAALLASRLVETFIGVTVGLGCAVAVRRIEQRRQGSNAYRRRAHRWRSRDS